MINFKIYFVILFYFFVLSANAQQASDIKFEDLKKKKTVQINFVESHLQIDGVLNDSAWLKAEKATDFIQTKPYNDRLAKQQTEFKVLYDHTAIYVAIKLWDTSPDSISTQLTQRDDTGQSDFAGFFLDPFDNSLISYGFFVTAAGVQTDIKFSSNNDDESWDAVWQSAVSIDEQGWNIEMKIPYSALRFPANEIQNNWGLNLYREHSRTREESTWNFVDNQKQTWLTQNGNLSGIKNIKPPLRLSVTPYFSSYLNTNSFTEHISYSFKGGLDLKYGINESYTLDMMLIPDFGQVQSDDEVLNLSPFETFYSEKRGFFTEGMELFNMAEIFHSRRIGGEPTRHSEISNELSTNEVLKENPENTQLLNATKITGTNANGLSIGVINAMTLNTYAIIEDTISGNSREILSQPFTNYNVFVLNKAMENNSYLSVINTNLQRFDDDYIANVFGFQTQLKDKNENYAIDAKGAFSNIKSKTEEPDMGFYYDLEFSKISGKYKFELKHRVESDTYNPNDLGYIQNPNELVYGLELSYQQNEPKGKVLNWHNEIEFDYRMLYYPRVYTQFSFDYSLVMQFKNHLTIGAYTNIAPSEMNNYFEARVEDRVFIEPKGIFGNFWISSSYAKKFAIDIRTSLYTNTDNTKELTLLFSPRWRINDKWFTRYSFQVSNTLNSYGFVKYTENQDTIFFGQRDLGTVTNTLSLTYTPNNKMGFDFRLRHYWSTVEYNKFFTLNENGYLDENNENLVYFENKNINFNSFTIDFAYKWNFAPGSELSIVWKNAIFSSGDIIIPHYFDNTKDLFQNSPVNNSFSFKILYYLDYLYLKKK